jgi:uncharacterized protein (DUF1810 family)
MMISRDIMIDGVNYTVSATTLRGLEEAVQYLQETLTQEKKRKEIEQLEQELNQSFDEVLEKFESGELPSRLEDNEEAKANETEVKPAEPEKKKPGRPRKNEE